MLPVAGAFLVLLPILWRPAADGHGTAVEGIYLFGVWAGLILIARLLATPLFAAGKVEDAAGTGLAGPLVMEPPPAERADGEVPRPGPDGSG